MNEYCLFCQKKTSLRIGPLTSLAQHIASALVANKYLLFEEKKIDHTLLGALAANKTTSYPDGYIFHPLYIHHFPILFLHNHSLSKFFQTSLIFLSFKLLSNYFHFMYLIGKL
jgi:hypothetical protein